MWLMIILAFILGVVVGLVIVKTDDPASKKMTNADARKRLSHDRPEPKTSPPLIQPINGVCKNGIWLMPIGSHDTDPFSKQDPKTKTPRPDP